MMDVVAAFGGGEARQTRTEERPERVERAAAGLADDSFECGEAQLDGVEVGTVGRQEAQRRAGRFTSVAHAVDFVRGEVVGNHHVTGLQRRDEDLFDVGEEAGPVHRAIEDPRRGEPRHPQRGDEGTALPPTLGRVIGDPLAAKAAPIAPQEIGGDPAFIQKDEASRGDRVRTRVPVFFTVKPSCFTARQIVARLADVPRATWRSARVRSGCSRIKAASVCSWDASTGCRP